MRATRGIIFIALTVAFVLALFGAFALFAPRDERGSAADDLPDRGGDTASPSGLSSADEAFAAWMTGATEDLTETVSRVEEAGRHMDLATARHHGQQLKALVESYDRSLDELTLPSALEPARSEFRAALAEYRMAAEHGEKGADSLDKEEINTARDHLRQASDHTARAMDMVNRTS